MQHPLDDSLLDRYTDLNIDTQLQIQQYIAHTEKMAAAVFFFVTMFGMLIDQPLFDMYLTGATALVLVLHCSRRYEFVQFIRSMQSDSHH
jgi:hypothetical protein